ncbi:MAG: methionine--tRNA ligase [Candidatus Aenigmarchaeota archaeon]|nr:methionine--tRNA ligase [Candidatus Aenigmarchaeota archaeon]
MHLVKGKFYITTAIPYVNAAPHIGHALEFVQTDVIARWHKLIGDEVFLTTGADENAQKNVQAAEEAGITTRQLCDSNAAVFRGLADKIGLSYDSFLRSSISKDHWPGVNKLWELCKKSGDIYKKKYRGLYCVGCEQFYTESELVNGLCPEHKRKPEIVEEENYFFRLSKYQKQIEKLIESGKLKIVPETRKHEVLSFVKQGLEDFSVSRSAKRLKGWGVPVPSDDSQIMYVWFDALNVYQTSIGFGIDEKKYKKWWPANLHVIGKGIVRFHAVYWPAILLSAGLKLPESILVHGYITLNGQKISKSLGNTIDPLELFDKYSVDAIRYFLVKEIPIGDDGDFSEKALINRINGELVADLGNLVYRVLSLSEKFKGKIEGKPELDKRLDLKKIQDRMENYQLNEALEGAWEFIRATNKYVNENEPWKLQGKELSNVLYNLLEACRVISILVSPFIPETSEKINEQLGVKEGELKDCKFEKFIGKIKKGQYLFKKIEDKI